MKAYIQHLIITSCLLFQSFNWIQANSFTANITKYTYVDYHMSPVNTCIDIDGLEAVFMANTNGVARFNGNTWNNIPLPFARRIYAVCALGDTLFVGGSGKVIGMTYGQHKEEMQYINLQPQVSKLTPYDFSVRSIEGFSNEDVYFSTSVGTLYYNGKELNYIFDMASCGKRLFKTTDSTGKSEIIVQGDDGVLYKFRKERAQLFCADTQLLKREVVMVSKMHNGCYTIATADGCLFTMNNESKAIELISSTYLRINTGTVSPDGRYLVLGTLGNGLHVRNLLTGQTVIYGADRLGSMNISHVVFTEQGQLWVALDCSAASITFNPSEFLWLTMQETGTLLDAHNIGNTTYLATSNGLFAATDEKVKRCADTPLVPTSLSVMNGSLLLGTIGQTARIEKDKLFPLETGGRIEGCSQVTSWSDELLLMRGFGGVFLLTKQGNKWRMVSNPVEEGTVKRAEFESAHILWILDIHDLTRLVLSQDLTTIVSKQSFCQVGGLSCEKGTFLIRWMGQCLCLNDKGVYAFDTKRQQMVRHELLSKAINTSEPILAVNTDIQGRLWIMTDAKLTCYNTDGIAEKRINLAGQTPLEYNGAYHFSVLGDSLLLLATAQGTMRYDLLSRNKENFLPRPPHFETVSYYSGDLLYTIPAKETTQVYLPANANRISLTMTNGLSNSSVKYTYSIDNGQNMPWQTNGSVFLDLLPYGKHHIIVNDNYGHTLQLLLVRNCPFYLSWYMIAIYLMLMASLVATLVIHHQRRKRKRLQQEMADRQRQFEEELRQKEKEQLLGRIETQSSQLKERMRFLTMKQEILNSLSTEIEAQKKEIGDHWPDRLYRRIIELIQRSRTEEDHLLSFENYFVDVHRDFMIRLQQNHPQLSPGELRFCCLLKANLSTKEIANILSITPRSVDLKKYRLKKKFELGEDDSLTSFIVGLE